MSFERLLSASIWARQLEHYDQLGQRAWSDGHVPWRVTTCPWVAHFEAEWIEAFAATHPGPLTVWDVGAGTGRLAFHLARELERRGVSATFLLTDVARPNVAAWHAQPQLQALREAGRLRLGVMNVLSDERPRDFETDVLIDVGPSVVLAHYLFDSLPCSAWRRADGQVQEGWVSLSDDQVQWAWRPATSSPPRLVSDAPCLHPDGAIEAISRIAAACGDRFVMLIIDKGANTHPTLARHHTVSAEVDFQALAAAHPSLNWLCTEPSPVLQLAAASPDALTRQLPDPKSLRHALEQVSAEPTTLTDLVALQTTLHDDPDTLAQLAEQAHRLLPTASLPEVEALVAAIARAADRHFVFHQTLDVPFTLGALAHAAGALRLAEALYLLSATESGELPGTLYNLAMICQATGRPRATRALLERTLALDPGHAKALALLAKLDG